MKPDQFKEIVLPLSSKMQAFATRMLGDADEAKDAVQEVFIKLWKMKGELKKYKSIEALAIKITKNHCLDKIKLKKTIPLENHYLNQKEDLSIFEYNNESLSQAVEKVKKGVEKLPEQQKLVMQLKDFEGYDYEEISFIMNMNINSVRVALSRARQKVKNYLIKNLQHGTQRNTGSFREIL